MGDILNRYICHLCQLREATSMTVVKTFTLRTVSTTVLMNCFEATKMTL